MPRFPSFVGGSYPANSSLVSQRTTNLYVEQNQEAGAENASMLCPTPGFRAWSAVADINDRGAVTAAGRMFRVIGAGFYEFFDDTTSTKWGTVAQDANPAQLVFNSVLGGQIGICSGGNIYFFTMATNTLSAAVIGPGFTHLAYAAGFGLAFNPTNGQTRLSNLFDFSVWDAGIFFRRSLFADQALAMFVDANNLVWIIGTDTFEVRYNTGVGSQPFSPLEGLVGRYGIAAPFAFGLTGSQNFWLSRNAEGIAQFVATRGSIPTPVSDYGVNNAISSYLRTSTISDAEVFTYQQIGHTWPVLSFPSPKKTWAYDVEGQGWAERGKWNPVTGAFELWTPRTHVFAFGKHLVGNRTSGTIYEMDTNLTTEMDGSGIVRERIAPLLTNEHQRTPLDSLELLMDAGVGTVSGLGIDPQVTLAISEDGGHTYGNERMASMGRMGNFKKRIYWTRLGAPQSATAKVRYSDPSNPSSIVDCWINGFEGHMQVA